MYTSFKLYLDKEIQSIKDAGLYKNECISTSPQGVEIELVKQPIADS